MKKHISALLLIAMLAGMASCGSEVSPASDVTGTSGGMDTTTAPETADPRLISDLPDKDLGGYEFRAAKQNPDKIAWSLNTFFVEEENGEVLNDTIFKRNQDAMEKYNFTIKETVTDKDPASTISQSVLAGDDEYDIVIGVLNQLNKIEYGILWNLMELPNLNLDKLYWDQNLVRDVALQGNLPFINGDILITDDESTMILTYNRPMAEDFKIENLYDVVRSGKWTVDKMLSCMKLVNEDLDANGKWDENDRYGLMFANNAAAAPYFGAFDVYLYEMDEKSGEPVFTGKSERAHTAFEKMNSILADTTISFDWSRITENTAAKVAGMLGNKQVLFQSMVLSMVRRNYRDIELDFGILPIPKFDEAQAEYGTIVNLSTPFISVPATVSKPDTVGFILEALAAASGDVTETYYSVCMESKYTRDEESYEMIDLARQKLTYDMGFVYNWGGLSASITSGIMTSGSTYASLVASYETAANEAMKLYLEKLQG